MIGINNLCAPTVQQPQIGDQGEINKITSSDSAPKAASPRSFAGAESQISSFSKALSDTATRAAERDANSSRQELAEIAHATFEKLCGDSYQKTKLLTISSYQPPMIPNVWRKLDKQLISQTAKETTRLKACPLINSP
ncbi:hypothetical protein [Pseudomonas sp. KNUC1026]|uniref:hypothetical protein n=1 Tax=Pseudomonas sp. KNUC1026 TaxID=2893890 RepID=UPI001F2464A5|nr:hypothetical protein [Pseudomonas sp. KNUC1026]UFH50617.1 hypothetical protein LN139_05390 [Pseudomonas sp. KNUC1026]